MYGSKIHLLWESTARGYPMSKNRNKIRHSNLKKQTLEQTQKYNTEESRTRPPLFMLINYDQYYDKYDSK